MPGRRIGARTHTYPLTPMLLMMVTFTMVAIPVWYSGCSQYGQNRGQSFRFSSGGCRDALGECAARRRAASATRSAPAPCSKILASSIGTADSRRTCCRRKSSAGGQKRGEQLQGSDRGGGGCSARVARAGATVVRRGSRGATRAPASSRRDLPPRASRSGAPPAPCSRAARRRRRRRGMRRTCQRVPGTLSRPPSIR